MSHIANSSDVPHSQFMVTQHDRYSQEHHCGTVLRKAGRHHHAVVHKRDNRQYFRNQGLNFGNTVYHLLFPDNSWITLEGAIGKNFGFNFHMPPSFKVSVNFQLIFSILIIFYMF